MFGKPRQVETETELYEAAVRALMRRAYSVYEMKQLLGRRTEDDKLLRTVMDRLKRAKMIDDERFAKQFARQRTEIRRQGKFRIARDLRARGVPDRHIEAALAEAAKEIDESPSSASASNANSAPSAARLAKTKWLRCIEVSCVRASPPTWSA